MMENNRMHLLGKKFLTNAILAVGLGSVALLAIPACLFLGLIGIIWSATDTVLKVLDR